jgi:hypothetical protein
VAWIGRSLYHPQLRPIRDAWARGTQEASVQITTYHDQTEHKPFSILRHAVRDWLGVAVSLCVFAIVLELAFANHPPRPLLGTGSGIVAGAAIIGVSMVLTGILVTCFVLLVLRVNVLSSMREELETARYHLDRIDLGESGVGSSVEASKTPD